MDVPQDLADEQASPPAGQADQRSGPRFTLLIRTAKLVSPEGEFCCVVRDISASGVKLRLFHPLPDGRPLELELANGDRFAIDPRWRRGDLAGFRFTAPINVPQFIHEPCRFRRRPVRLRLQLPALLCARGLASPAVVLDLSRQGARIETSARLAHQETVRIDAASLPPRIAKVCWRRGGAYGLVFEETFRFDELARLAWDAQCAADKAESVRIPAKR